MAYYAPPPGAPPMMGVAPPVEDSRSRTVYVGNVAATMDENMLRALFSNCGTVTSVRVAGDPTYNARYAFVEFATSAMANTAVLLNGFQCVDRQIKVSMAQSGLQKGGGGGGGPPPQMGMPRGGGEIKGDYERVMRTIHIQNLEPHVNELHLAQYFGPVGAVSAVRVAGDATAPTRMAWVEFATRESAALAQAYDGQLIGMIPIKVSASKSEIKSNGLLKFQARGVTVPGMPPMGYAAPAPVYGAPPPGAPLGFVGPPGPPGPPPGPPAAAAAPASLPGPPALPNVNGAPAASSEARADGEENEKPSSAATGEGAAADRGDAAAATEEAAASTGAEATPEAAVTADGDGAGAGEPEAAGEAPGSGSKRRREDDGDEEEAKEGEEDAEAKRARAE